MKVKQGEFLLLLMFSIRHITARHTADISTILHNLNAKNINPLLVVVGTTHVRLNDKYKQTSRELQSDDDDIDYTGDDGTPDDDYVYDDPKNEAKTLLYNYLLRNGPTPQNTEEEIENDRKNLLRTALIARCQARVQCEKKCPKEEKSYCPVNCKAVFDSLDLCDPPKKKKTCKEDDPCAKRGKTMPPDWRF